MTPLSVIAFPGAPNLPVFAAQAHGFFADAGIELRFETTPSSTYQFEHFAAGAFDIAFTAFDNVVAYNSGQGAAAIDVSCEFCAVMGTTQIELSLVVSPDVATVDDLRGKSLALDAVGTGFAFVLYDMLAAHGLGDGDYEIASVGATPERWRSVKEGAQAGTIAIEPFTSIARATGFPTLLKSSDFYPAYQGGVIAVRRDWAAEHGAALEAFLGAYARGLDWVLDPANRDAAAALLAQRMPAVQPQAMAAVMASLLSPRSGLTPDGAILRDGARQVLDLRAKYGPGGAPMTDADRHIDLSWWDRVREARAR
ncbi:ABC transporter substrate-binding protein [Sphingomonas koreensis]|nr:ABC transporter substrate-binding protein [Sphingomonas koreensis]